MTEDGLRKEACAYMEEVAGKEAGCGCCDTCWKWRTDTPCHRREIREAYIAGANRESRKQRT